MPLQGKCRDFEIPRTYHLIVGSVGEATSLQGVQTGFDSRDGYGYCDLMYWLVREKSRLRLLFRKKPFVDGYLTHKGEDQVRILRSQPIGEMTEWTIVLPWKGRGPEIWFRGSNPTFSAKFIVHFGFLC